MSRRLSIEGDFKVDDNECVRSFGGDRSMIPELSVGEKLTISLNGDARAYVVTSINERDEHGALMVGVQVARTHETQN